MTMTKAEQRKFDRALADAENIKTLAQERYDRINNLIAQNRKLVQALSDLKLELEAETKNVAALRYTLSGTQADLNKCLGWISAKLDEHPTRNSETEEPVEHFGYVRPSVGRHPL